MKSFIVSARKYRPKTFDEVVGQEHVTDTLKNAIANDRVAHAYLFCGPRGVGKTSCARILAKTINCDNRTEQHEACGACVNCVSFDQANSMTIIELDAASNNSVENIRSLIDQVRYPPQHGRYRVFIIDEVHMLSTQAFNAFLKTLEEPPSHALFILATTEKPKILPTILSRCQVYDFRRITVGGMVEQLSQICRDEEITFDTEALRIIAEKSDGAMRDALSIFDRVVSLSDKVIQVDQVSELLNVLDQKYYLNLTKALLLKDTPAMLSLIDEILLKGFEQTELIQGLSNHFRTLLMCQMPNTIELLEVSDEMKEQLASQANAARKDFLLNAMSLINECGATIKTSFNPRFQLELYLLKIIYAHTLVTEAPLQVNDNIDKKKTLSQSR